MESTLSKDYFDLFGFPETYQVDVNVLTKRYRELQHTIHPDNFVNASVSDKGLSIRLAAHVNDAYTTLKNPLLRARYLLQARGVDMSDENPSLSPEFLGEQIELREQLEEIRESKAPANVIMNTRKTLEKNINDIQEQLQEQFTLNSMVALEKARGLSYEIQFMFKLQEEVDDMEDELGL